MSQPPPPPNPDPRPLPDGWIQQYDNNYRAWFYVNTRANPPVTTWTHPLGPPPTSPPPPPSYAPPAGSPPPNNPYNNNSYGYNEPRGEYGYNNQYGPGPGPGYGQGYGGNSPSYYPQQQQQYQQEGGKGLLGGLFGGRHSNQPQYGQPPPQAVYEQAPPKKSGLSTGGALALGAGAGLGAFLIGDAIEDHIQNEEYQSYEQGFDDGQRDDDYGGGDGW